MGNSLSIDTNGCPDYWTIAKENSIIIANKFEMGDLSNLKIGDTIDTFLFEENDYFAIIKGFKDVHKYYNSSYDSLYSLMKSANCIDENLNSYIVFDAYVYDSQSDYIKPKLPISIFTNLPFYPNVNVEFANVPMFSVITGKNGIGKTQFLRQLYFENYSSKYSGDDRPAKILSKKSSAHLFAFFKLLISFELVARENLSDISLSALLDRCRRSNSKTQNSLKNIDLTQNFYFNQLEVIAKDNNANLNYYINNNDVFSKRMSSSINLDPFEDITNYLRLTYISYHNSNLYTLNFIPNAKSKVSNPVLSINTVLQELDFPYYLDNNFYQDNAKIQFINKESVGHIHSKIDFDYLSDGEKYIFKLAVLTAESLNNNTIIILDEPDAHFHPYYCKIMVDTLTKISQMGTRVIITSHNPVTIACAPEGSVFVMQDIDDTLKEIVPVSHRDAIEEISQNLDFHIYENVFGIVSDFLNCHNKNVIVVEGSTDVSHLRKAINILDRESLKENNCDIITVNGSDNFSSFLNFVVSPIFKKNYEKNIIFLGDCDEAGKHLFENSGLKKMPKDYGSNVYQHKSNNSVFALTLQTPEDCLDTYCPIEFLYNYEFLANYKTDTGFGIIQKISDPYDDMKKPMEMSEDSRKLFNAEVNKESSTNLIAYVVNGSYIDGSAKKNPKSENKMPTIKDKFAEYVQSIDNISVFENFNPTLDTLEKIIKTLSN